jgi:hypothetical protein
LFVGDNVLFAIIVRRLGPKEIFALKKRSDLVRPRCLGEISFRAAANARIGRTIPDGAFSATQMRHTQQQAGQDQKDDDCS